MDAAQLVLKQWVYALKSEHKSPQTIRSYTESLRMLVQHLGADCDPLTITTEQLREWIGHLLDTRSPSTAAVRYRSMQQFFAWAVRDELIEKSPMASMRPPSIPEVPVPVIPLADIEKLLKVVDGKSFLDRRDCALFRLMLEPGGMRRAEAVGIKVTDVDLEFDTVTVTGKGRRIRAIPYGAKTGQALTRYLQARLAHPYAKRTDALWLAQRGGLTDNGLGQALERRCAQAGIDRVHAHQLRHTAADDWFAAGGSDQDAMRLFDWRSSQMTRRYGASNATARAHDHARQLARGDRF